MNKNGLLFLSCICSKIVLVHQKGLEPLARGFEGHCSIQLSYWCI